MEAHGLLFVAIDLEDRPEQMVPSDGFCSELNNPQRSSAQMNSKGVIIDSLRKNITLHRSAAALRMALGRLSITTYLYVSFVLLS